MRVSSWFEFLDVEATVGSQTAAQLREARDAMRLHSG
jgi:hypothetical protein